MEQTKALNALEPFLALQKSANSHRAAAEIVSRATSAPSTYLFAELLESPGIRSLAAASDKHAAAALRQLELFSYGTYAEYVATPGLPPLGPAQKLKLRQLSLLTLARSRDNLAYEALRRQLGLGEDDDGKKKEEEEGTIARNGNDSTDGKSGSANNARDLEDLVISAVYAGLLDATLDPHRQAVQVHSVAPLRDLAPGAVPPMISSLKAWSARCTDTLDDLEKQVEAVRTGAGRRGREKQEQDDALEKLLVAYGGVGGVGGMVGDDGIMETQAGGGGGGGGGVAGGGAKRVKRGAGPPEAEAMDVDDDEEGVKSRASKRKL